MSTALQADAKALAAWQDITPLARNNWICWVTIVKKVDTPKEQVERGPIAGPAAPIALQKRKSGSGPKRPRQRVEALARGPA